MILVKLFQIFLPHFTKKAIYFSNLKETDAIQRQTVLLVEKTVILQKKPVSLTVRFLAKERVTLVKIAKTASVN